MASRGSYQRDDGCAGTSQRHDVEVVGEVELRTEKGSVSGLGEEMRNRAEEEQVGSAPSHLAGVTDLSQSGSARFPRCGVHGNNTYRIRGMKRYRAAAFSSEDKKVLFFLFFFIIIFAFFFPSPETV